MSTQQASSRAATLAHVAPFAGFVGIMAVEKTLSVPPDIAYTIRFLAVCALVLIFSWRYLPFRPSNLAASIGIGVAVFIIWIGPDLIFGYRDSILFSNAITGKPESSFPADLVKQTWFIAVRTFSCMALVPIVEELFWRGWLMRWLIHHNFLKVPLGKYDPLSFWVVAVLFAVEHGPYWEVGLAAGIIYNWWIVRTRNLADCILAHAVTNGLLSAYVVSTGKWQYLL